MENLCGMRRLQIRMMMMTKMMEIIRVKKRKMKGNYLKIKKCS
jgi:hypothetical protein